MLSSLALRWVNCPNQLNVIEAYERPLVAALETKSRSHQTHVWEGEIVVEFKVSLGTTLTRCMWSSLTLYDWCNASLIEDSDGYFWY